MTNNNQIDNKESIELGLLENQYLSLMESVLTDLHRIDRAELVPITVNGKGIKSRVLLFMQRFFRKKRMEICRPIRYEREMREDGRDWPTYSETMIGLKRLRNIKHCLLKIIEDGIDGDVIETGVWRGGATIYMKAILNLFDEHDRVVWLADSFEGLPKPSKEYPADSGDKYYTYDELKVSEDSVLENFRKYDLLDDNVKTLKGWFKDTLPEAPMEKLALLRLDGDMYESTMDALVNLYPKLAVGGFIIIDDYSHIKACKAAVEDYRKQENITDEIIPVDWTGVYWRKSNETAKIK